MLCKQTLASTTATEQASISRQPIQIQGSQFAPTAHAKGLLVEGTFTPTEEVKTLYTAAHFNNSLTKVITRFSVGDGLPHVADAADGATPKGVAICFQVDENTHTDLISHSFNGFATRNGEDFLTFLKLFGADGFAEAQLKKAKGAVETTPKSRSFMI